MDRNWKEKPLPRTAKGFKVKAELKMTHDKGIGVFAAQFIPANMLLKEPCLIFYNEQEARSYLASLSNDEERKKWLEFCWGQNGKVATSDESKEDGNYVNHSDNPTMAEKQDGNLYSTRDIEEGEELTEDYATFENVPLYNKLCEEYGVVDWFVKPSDK